MIPAFVAAMHPVHVVAMDHAATGVILSITLEPARLPDAAAVLDREGYLLEDVMASDLTEGIEVQYHFSLLDGPTRLVLRLIVPHDAPDVPSIAAIYPGANWHECECFDFYGIRFVGHPDLHRLLLPEDFEGHPLLKAPETRRSLGELMPSSYCRACGLAEPDTPAAASAPAVKTGPSDA